MIPALCREGDDLQVLHPLIDHHPTAALNWIVSVVLCDSDTPLPIDKPFPHSSTYITVQPCPVIIINSASEICSSKHSSQILRRGLHDRIYLDPRFGSFLFVLHVAFPRFVSVALASLPASAQQRNAYLSITKLLHMPTIRLF